jgi:hypothetical protein
MEKIRAAALVDEHFVPHGNWGGVSLGGVCCGWLVHILSEGDHRMNHVQPQAEKRGETLCVRLDGTTVSGCWRVTEDGLFQCQRSSRAELSHICNQSEQCLDREVRIS